MPVIRPEARAALDEIAAGYEIFHRRRVDLVSERKLWGRIKDCTEALAADLRIIKRRTTWAAADPMWTNDALVVLTSIKGKCERQLEFYETIARPGYRHDARAFLYRGLMDVWTDHLGGKLTRSTTAGRPAGPLIQFMDTELRKVLGDKTPAADTLADIIKQEQARRAKRRRKTHGGVRRKK